jgi:hypothetical protein
MLSKPLRMSCEEVEPMAWIEPATLHIALRAKALALESGSSIKRFPQKNQA